MLRCTSRFVASAKIASIRAVCSSWTVVPIRRSISNDQNSCDSFPSLLKDLNVVSPFDDPARRQKVRTIFLLKIYDVYTLFLFFKYGSMFANFFDYKSRILNYLFV